MVLRDYFSLFFILLRLFTSRTWFGAKRPGRDQTNSSTTDTAVVGKLKQLFAAADDGGAGASGAAAVDAIYYC